MAKNFVLAQTALLFNTATLTGGYDLFGAISNPSFLLHFYNASNTLCEISYDAAHTQDFVAPGETYYLTFQTNSQPQGNVSLIRKGNIYVLGAAGVGYLYMAAYYQQY